MTYHHASPQRRVLDPADRLAEVLFGLIMVLSFTGSLSAATAGREEVRTLLLSAIGCNAAWGIVDAVMFVLAGLAERTRGYVILRNVQRAGDASTAHRTIAAALPPIVATVLGEEGLASIREKLRQLPAPPTYARPTWSDLWMALGVFALVFLSTFPVVIPFLFFRQNTLRAMRVSNLVAIVLLYVLGHSLGRHTGQRPVALGLGMVAIGAALVLIVIALGG